MLNNIIQNIKDFYDTNIFFIILGIGLFALLVDYKFFKKVNFKKDAKITAFIGVFFLILPFVLLIISQM